MLASVSLLLAAAWAGDGPAAVAASRDSVLLISLNGATHELDPATGQLGRQIASGNDGVVSPNRTHVAYVRDTDPCAVQVSGFCWLAQDLLTADITGAGERAIVESVDDGVHRFSPDWSPDGSRILFSWSGLPGEGRGVAWVRPDGSGFEQLQFGAMRGSFSPDGKWIAFIHSFTSDVHVLNLATRQTTALTTDGSADAGSAPDWSPDGRRIAYASFERGVYVLDTKTGETVNLTEGWTTPVSGFETPVYSPNGNEIAFVALDNSALPEGEAVRRVYAVSASGGVPRTVSDHNGFLTDWLRL
jgi:Tol biopolymer transport system component